jgi:hypothetical protein
MVAARALARTIKVISTIILLVGTIGFCSQVNREAMSSPVIIICGVVILAGLIGFLVGKVIQGRSD